MFIYFRPHLSSWEILKLSFINIRNPGSNFVGCKFFPWIKFSWYYCVMWGKCGRVSWLEQFLSEGLLSINPKGFFGGIKFVVRVQGMTQGLTNLLIIVNSASISSDYIQIVNFPTLRSDWYTHSHGRLDLFSSSYFNIFYSVSSIHWVAQGILSSHCPLTLL